MCNVYCSENVHVIVAGSDIPDLAYCRNEIGDRFLMDAPSADFYADHGFMPDMLIRIVSVDPVAEGGEVPEYQLAEGYPFPFLVGVEILDD